MRKKIIAKKKKKKKEKIYEICNSIPHDTLKGVFQDWIRRSDWVAYYNGEYYSKY